MNNRSKTIFIILGTFLMGMISGSLINRSLTQHRIRKILSQRRPAAFTGFFERILDPTPEQAPEIKQILDSHARENSKLRQEFFNATQNSLTSLLEELDPFLSDEKRERISDFLKRPPWGAPGRPPHSMFTPPEEEAALLQKQLHLTAEQVKKLRAILQEPPPRPKLSSESPSDFPGQRGIFRNFREEKNRAIMEILTDEQKHDFLKILDQQKNRRPTRQFPPGKP